MSLVTYNGVTLPYPFTTRFLQEPLRDDVSGTDWYVTRFDIQVQCIINIQYLQSMTSRYGTVTTGNAATVMELVRVDLLKHRKTLSFQCNGVEMIPSRAGVPGTVDAMNGPMPQSCSVVGLTNDTFLLSYHVVAHYWEKYTGANRTSNLPGNEILYNRWSETVEMDQSMYSVRTREGQFKIRSDNLTAGIADQFRIYMAVVGVPQGFLRKSSNYTVTPDGLILQYRVVDQEVFKTPPQPAYEASGDYTESAGNSAVVVYGEVNLRLRGCKDKNICPQTKLLETAVAIAAIKLDINGGGTLISVSIRIGMYDNTVEVRMRAMCNAGKVRLKSTTLGQNFSKLMCLTPYSEDGEPFPTYKARGTAAILLEAANYFDPSLRGVVLKAGSSVASTEDNVPVGNSSQLSAGVAPGQAGRIREP